MSGDPARQPGPRRNPLDALRPSYDGPRSWLWFVGLARIAVLLVVVAGTQFTAATAGYGYFLGAIYAGAFLSCLWYLAALRREQSAILTWTQVLVDFATVAATISFTGGQSSFFTFLLVIVILEAGVLMGLVQAFVFATLSSAFMFVQALLVLPLVKDPLSHWYNFLIQAIALFFTAFISGYWNQRVSRMKQFQREILDNMSSGFLITDAKGILIAMNRSACQILGLAEGSVAGRHVEGILRPALETECPVTTALRIGRDFTSYEFDALTGTGESILLGLTTNRIRDSYGNVTGLIASFTNLTEMSRMRRELRKQDRMAVIGELSAGLAHEIRNPVASIRGAVDELAGNIDQPKMVERLARIALRESEHLNEIVTGFLDFARDPGRRHQVLDVREVLLDVAEQLRRKYARHPEAAAAIVYRGPETPCHVTGDVTQLRQVFMNLGQNAIEAMQERGTAAFVLSADGRGPVEVLVEDEGPGIAPDKVARIFEPFYTEKERGVGMGLAICMRIITAHDGTIQVLSRPKGGTIMCVRLPQAGADSEPPRRPSQE